MRRKHVGTNNQVGLYQSINCNVTLYLASRSLFAIKYVCDRKKGRKM